jgi:hypothetical protein
MKPADPVLVAWLVELCHDRQQQRKVHGLIDAAQFALTYDGNPYHRFDDWTETEIAYCLNFN